MSKLTNEKKEQFKNYLINRWKEREHFFSLSREDKVKYNEERNKTRRIFEKTLEYEKKKVEETSDCTIYDETIKKIKETEGDDLDKCNKLLINISLSIRGSSNPEWVYGEGWCEDCGFNRATVNLELKYGSHRECMRCWSS